MNERFLNDRIELHCGDCLDVLATLDECSIDACVTDSPYHLTSIVKRFGGENAAPAQFGSDGRYARASAGFMGRKWDGGDIAFRPETWATVYRVLKPGAHLIAMGGTRTYHRLACAIEDAGFEIRDTVSWLYGSGFPKSHDVSKVIDRAAGAERETVGNRDRYRDGRARQNLGNTGGEFLGLANGVDAVTAPATDAAREWAGWGTALKPACELIVLARKPLSEGTVAANVLRWGCGAINVDGCRVEHSEECKPMAAQNFEGREDRIIRQAIRATRTTELKSNGRWPANVVHDGSDEVVAAFPDAPGQLAAVNGNEPSAKTATVWGTMHRVPGDERTPRNDSGSAARFFYTSKADADDRLGSKHPTVKPLDLMQWLVRLVTPPKGIVLDCFAGTGTLGEAAWREGMRAVLIEAEPEYQEDIRRRMKLVLGGPEERARESIKAKNLPRDDGPLFGGSYELPKQDVAAEFDDETEPPADPFDFSQVPSAVAKVPRDDGPLFAHRETWAEMWAKPFDFSREPRP